MLSAISVDILPIEHNTLHVKWQLILSIMVALVDTSDSVCTLCHWIVPESLQNENVLNFNTAKHVSKLPDQGGKFTESNSEDRKSFSCLIVTEQTWLRIKSHI